MKRLKAINPFILPSRSTNPIEARSHIVYTITKHIELKQQQEQDARTKLIIHKRVDLSTDPLRNDCNTEGDRRLALLRHTLNNMGIKRSVDQQQFHEHFIHACLPQIYGNDWEENSVRILEQEKLQLIERGLLIMTPRRWGKTWSVASFAAALLLSVPKVKIAIFSTGKRTSSALMEIIITFIKNIEGGQKRIVKKTSEQLYISTTPLQDGLTSNSSVAREQQTAEDTSVLNSYPASVTGLFLSF